MLVGMSTDPTEHRGSPQVIFAEVRLVNGRWVVENDVAYYVKEVKTPHEAAKKYLSEVCQLQNVSPLRPGIDF